MNDVAFASGCFDLLHSGHIAFLESAARYGALIVSVGSDATIAALKGRPPVCSEQERLYMVQALKCVDRAVIGSGSGQLDFEPELRRFAPTAFVVNTDGDRPEKRQLCDALNIQYHVLRREPVHGFPSRSTTALRACQGLPARVDLAGGWLDQPFVSSLAAGSVIVASIAAPVDIAPRSGLATSTRATAESLWGNRIPPGDPLQLAHVLFACENPPGKQTITGSQDALGIVLPGLQRLHYAGGYWPEKIEAMPNREAASWLAAHASLVRLAARPADFDIFTDMQLTTAGVRELATAAEETWEALRTLNLPRLIHGVNQTSIVQARLFPRSLSPEHVALFEAWRGEGFGVKFAGAGGGGYALVIGSRPLEIGLPLRVRTE